jgi:hypothetical protein
MNDDIHLPGSDSYEGHCPECGSLTYTCYNEICDDCFDEQNHQDEITDEEADAFVKKYNDAIEMRLIVNDMIKNIETICNEYKPGESPSQQII